MLVKLDLDGEEFEELIRESVKQMLQVKLDAADYSKQATDSCLSQVSRRFTDLLGEFHQFKFKISDELIAIRARIKVLEESNVHKPEGQDGV